MPAASSNTIKGIRMSGSNSTRATDMAVPISDTTVPRKSNLAAIGDAARLRRGLANITISPTIITVGPREHDQKRNDRQNVHLADEC